MPDFSNNLNFSYIFSLKFVGDFINKKRKTE